MPALQQLKSYLEAIVKRGDTELEKFQSKLTENPATAFQWADSVMSCTAKARVAKHYLGSIAAWETARDAGTLSEKQPQDEDAAVEFIRTSVVRTALQKCRFTNRSTSICANAMEDYDSAMYAELAAEWDFIY